MFTLYSNADAAVTFAPGHDRENVGSDRPAARSPKVNRRTFGLLIAAGAAVTLMPRVLHAARPSAASNVPGEY